MSELDHILKTGNGSQVIVYGDLWPKGLLCTASPSGWIPTERTASPSQNPGGGSGETSPVPAGQIGQMIQLWYDNANKWTYGQGSQRLNPEASGYTDCSAAIWWAINKINPSAAAKVGTWTGTMATSGKEIARGTRNDPFPTDKAKAGDILLIEWGYVNYSFNDVSSHVEWYVGDGRLWGAGYAPLPHDSGNAVTYCRSSGVGCWMLRRVIEES